ncbi:hypothetical protein [Algibacter sp. PT7-4]|uniref:hypothetical protein n=1 Tax=Algibacter ulvanivorans TaxID=3400999 RepID=UPI003AAE71C2
MRKLLFFLVLSSSLIAAQGPQGRAVNLSSGSNGLGGNGYGTNNLLNFVKGEWTKTSSTKNTISGTNYLFNTWSNTAEIYDLSGKGYKLPNCNFNVASNSVEAMFDDATNKTFVFNTKDLSKVRIGNKVFIKKETNNQNNYLLEIIEESSNVSLYKKYETEVVLASVNPMTQQKMGKDKIDIKHSYLVETNGKLKALKIKKSTILKLMSDKKDYIKTFIKDNKLSVAKENDLKQIFKYYNSIK